MVVNYLARWVQDPENNKKKRENAILDSLRIVSTTLDLKHPEKAGTLGGQLHSFGGNLETKLKEVKTKIPAEITSKVPAIVQEKLAEKNGDSTPEVEVPPPAAVAEEEPQGPGGYTLTSVKKIDP